MLTLKLKEHFNAKGYVPETAEQLARRFQTTANRAAVFEALAELEDEGFIAASKQGVYQLAAKLGVHKGVADRKAAGYLFVTPEGETKGVRDIYVARENTLGAMNRDVVLVRVIKRSGPDRIEGAVLKIVERELKQVVGEYFQGAIFPRKPIPDVLFRVSGKHRQGLKEHSVVVAKIESYHPNGILDCVPLSTLGSINDPDVVMREVLAEHGVEVEFPDAVLNEVASVPALVLEADLRGRKDLRSEFIVTIDGDDTKDIDDAVSIKELPSGSFELGVHIADVSHYVKEGSALDRNAYLRGTSVYLADRVVPMLPKELSNGICSLNPGVDRLTLTATMEIDQEGSIVKSAFHPSVIHSRHQMTYKKCNLILDQDSAALAEYPDMVAPLEALRKLQAALERRRKQEGSLDFETIEPKLKLDESGNVLDIVVRERGLSERIIEECMLAANVAVATHFSRRNLPFLYRIHDKPDPMKIQAVFLLAKALGAMKKAPSSFTPFDLQALTEKARGTAYEKVIDTMLLRAMAKAKYSPDNIGHYGLAFEDYAHFTSPIRRYPDLIVHRLMRSYVFDGKIDRETQGRIASSLEDIGLSTSASERRAMLVEREVLDIKKAAYMTQFIGQTFEGVVSSLNRFGMFVELPNTVEGLIRLERFPEAIEFSEADMSYLGISTRKVYNIGTLVNVRVVKTNPALGQIDFELAVKGRS